MRDLTKLFSDSGPAVLAFITRLSSGTKPHFPTIFGTGFFVDSSGLAATNRHVIEVFAQLPPHPRTGESALAAVLFLPGNDEYSWQVLRLDVLSSNVLSEFTSTDTWYGQTVPDIGFVQLRVRENPTLKLASEKHYLKVGMDVATIGYPMGTPPLTALGKLNQASPFVRHGIVSSVFPCPTPLPHGFTVDIMQQGGSSGSPIFRTDDGVVVGMMSSSVVEWKVAQSQDASMAYAQNTNISIAEPSHIIQKAMELFRSSQSTHTSSLPTLAELRAAHPRPSKSTELTWDTWIEPSPGNT
jgi:S1-C subfamily serine protease